MYSKKSYVEHVAYFVKDIHWHIGFFQEALGMPVVGYDGEKEDPKQVWLMGGLQLISDPGFVAGEGRMGHIAIITEDLEQALEAVYTWGCSGLPKGRNWVQLPDGLVLELIQEKANSVNQLLSVEVSYVTK